MRLLPASSSDSCWVVSSFGLVGLCVKAQKLKAEMDSMTHKNQKKFCTGNCSFRCSGVMVPVTFLHSSLPTPCAKATTQGKRALRP